MTVRGLRASGAGIAGRLRPGVDPTGNSDAHRRRVRSPTLRGITSAHFMAQTVPFVKPATIVANSGYFGPAWRTCRSSATSIRCPRPVCLQDKRAHFAISGCSASTWWASAPDRRTIPPTTLPTSTA
ncbi:conserved membrane domain protein [Mycobacterium xenopi 4042]|uniref:Conserved membrane domain protein n=1 Tax=Mycobacterium xenopi 4042 TaxID=1299334 RepID=X8BGS3_MYCXE|nr:conserved membrane domain protein [Mycobacterium xenopi 4042]